MTRQTQEEQGQTDTGGTRTDRHRRNKDRQTQEEQGQTDTRDLGTASPFYKAHTSSHSLTHTHTLSLFIYIYIYIYIYTCI